MAKNMPESALSLATLGGLGILGGLFLTTLAGCGGIFAHFELEVIAKKLPVGVHDALRAAFVVNLATRGEAWLATFNAVTRLSLTVADVPPLVVMGAWSQENLRALLVLWFFALALYRDFLAPVLQKEKAE